MFRNKSYEVDFIVDSIVWSVSCWASRRKEFVSVSMIDLNLSWAGFFPRMACQIRSFFLFFGSFV